MTCNQAEELILDTLVAPPGTADGETLAAHLAACGACRAFRESQAALDGALARHMTPPVPSPGFDARLLRALTAGRAAEYWDLVPDALHLAGGALVTLVAAMARPADAGLVWSAGIAATIASYAIHSLVRQWLNDAQGETR